MCFSFLRKENKEMNNIILSIPLNRFGHLATAAALDGIDITRWVKRKIQRGAADGSFARFAAERKAAMQAAADDAAGNTAAAVADAADTVNPAPSTAADA